MLYELDPGIYPRKIWLSVNQDVEELRSLFPDEDIPPLDDSYYAETRVVSKDRRSGYLIRFASKKEMTPSTIAHEAGHVAIRIFNVIESEISITTSEPFCYLLDWIVKRVLECKKEE